MGFISMKMSYNTPVTFSRKRLLSALTLGISCLVTTIVFMVIDPVMILCRYNLRLAEGTYMHELLEKNLEAVHISVYLFNMTNADRFMSGEDSKLKLQEVGPFVYREYRTNDDVEFDAKAGVVRYSPNTKAYFMPEKSIANPKDVNVTMPNAAIMAITSMLSSYSYFVKMGFDLFAKNLKSKPIVTTDVEQFLWGYEEPLVKLGNTLMPGLINFDRAGILSLIYDKKKNYRLEVGTTDADKFMIKKYNGEKGLIAWDYEDPAKRSRCNTFVDTYEGLGYPPGLTPETPIRLFRNVMCSMIELDFAEQRVSKYGVDAFVYKISNRTFNRDPDNECHCTRGNCANGISDVSPCYYGLPLAISNAHFLYADQSYFERIEGLNPDEAKFGSEIIVEPKLGAVLSAEVSVQANIVIKNVTTREMRNFANMVLPVAYFKLVLPELPDENKAILNLIFFTAPKLMLALNIVLFITGLALLAYSSRLMYWIWLCSDSRGIAFQLPTDEKQAMFDEIKSNIIISVDDKLLGYTNEESIEDNYIS